MVYYSSRVYLLVGFILDCGADGGHRGADKRYGQIMGKQCKVEGRGADGRSVTPDEQVALDGRLCGHRWYETTDKIQMSDHMTDCSA